MTASDQPAGGRVDVEALRDRLPACRRCYRTESERGCIEAGKAPSDCCDPCASFLALTELTALRGEVGRVRAQMVELAQAVVDLRDAHYPPNQKRSEELVAMRDHVLALCRAALEVKS
jgi:hypothetical protein